MKNTVSDANAPDNIPSNDAIKSNDSIEPQYSTYSAFQKKKKRCEECGHLFVAKTIASRFCSKKCSSHSYYKQNRQKISSQQIEKRWHKRMISPQIKLAKAIPSKDADFLSVIDFATRLGICKQTVYNMQKRGQVRIYNFSERLSFISWTEFEAMTLARMPNQSTKSIPERTESKSVNPEILKIQTGKNNQACDIEPLTQSKSKPKCTPISGPPSMSVPNDSPKWITSDMACERYSFTTKGNFHTFISKNKVPKKRKCGTLLYSVAVMDKCRGYNIRIPLGFISSVEAQNKYQVKGSNLWLVFNKNKITKIKKGCKIYFPEIEIRKRYKLRVDS